MALKCTVVELVAWDRQTDRQTAGQTDGSQPLCPASFIFVFFGQINDLILFDLIAA